MKVTRREFIQVAALTAGTLALGQGATSGVKEGMDSMSPAINPVYLTGSMDDWPLDELARLGYKSLELPAQCLEDSANWFPAMRKAGLRLLCVNALPELRPYLTGSLSDAVEWRRKDTLSRLKAALGRMPETGATLMIVAPSRQAENYQTQDAARELLVSSLKELSDAAPEGVSVLVASCPFRLFATSDLLAGIVDSVGRKNVAAALDVGHTVLTGEQVSVSVDTLGDRLKYVQVHDVDVRPGVPRLDRHLPLGHGSLGRDELRAVTRRFPWSIGITAPDSPIETAKAAMDWLNG
jgi:sugar phosphate isomerase/epimerase